MHEYACFWGEPRVAQNCAVMHALCPFYNYAVFISSKTFSCSALLAGSPVNSVN